jgi:membrane dipeptidase
MTPVFLSPVLIQFLLGAALLAPSSPAQRLQNLLSDLLILDTHIDTANCIVDEGYQVAEEHAYYQTDIPRLRRGRVGAVFFGVWVEQEFPSQVWVTRTLDLIDALREQVRRNPQDLEMASMADDIVRIHRSGKVAALVGLEGGQLISDSLPVLRDYYRLGVRYMTLTHFKANDWADSSTDPAVHNGLTPFGRDIVREMNRLGMMVDISHVSDKTFYDVLETTRAPVIASHSSMRALCNVPRNMSDDMIRALARNGGVVFINFAMPFLDEKTAAAFARTRADRDREVADMLALNRSNPRRWELRRDIFQRYNAQLPPVDISAVLRHIDHAVQTIGADHVGIGSDFDGISDMVPNGLEDVSKFPALVQGLIDRGYSDTDIRKIMGENLLRVMRANEAVSRQIAGK